MSMMSWHDTACDNCVIGHEKTKSSIGNNRDADKMPSVLCAKMKPAENSIQVSLQLRGKALFQRGDAVRRK